MTDNQNLSEGAPNPAQSAPTAELPAMQPNMEDMGKSPEALTQPHHKDVSIGLAVGAAILIALVLVLIGILAYQKSDVTTDLDQDSATEVVDESDVPLNQENATTELDTLQTELDSMDAELDQLGDADITDTSLGLE